MNTLPPSGEPESHLDDEALSAAVDDEATGDELAHLERCPTCQARMAVLASVAAQVAAPPTPVPVVVRDATLSAALDHFDGRAAAGTGAGPRPAVASRPAAVRSLRRPRQYRRAQREPDRGPWVGLAALILLVVVAIPLLSNLSVFGNGSDDAMVASSVGDDAGSDSGGGSADVAEAVPDDDMADDDMAAATGPSADAPTAEGSAGDAPVGDALAGEVPVDVGDLGAIERDADLGAVVDRALRVGRLRAAAEGESTDGEDTDGAGTDGEGTDETSTDETPSAEELAGNGRSGPQDETGTCVEPVRTVLDEPGALVLQGRVTVDGAPATVLGFDGDGDGEERATVIVAVVALEGCDLLAARSYATG